MRLLVIALLLAAGTAHAALVGEVRRALAANDFAKAEALVQEFRRTRGVTPEMILGLSWLGRGALAAGALDTAERYAAETRALCLEALRSRALDADKDLPLALGAAQEVQAQVLARRGQRSEALAFLHQELAQYWDTSIRTRIQKNIHLLSLEGRPAPPVAIARHVGPEAPKPLEALKGSPLILFFWAHWCGDCKFQAPILARLAAEFGPRGLKIVAPTQRYGYAARGEEASPEEELAYIGEIFRQFYAGIPGLTALSGAITRIVSSPAMVPTTSGHSSLSSETATELACPGAVFSTTRFWAERTSRRNSAARVANCGPVSPAVISR
jgi:thiol-disulfide isomerase/thioredoxin